MRSRVETTGAGRGPHGPRPRRHTGGQHGRGRDGVVPASRHARHLGRHGRDPPKHPEAAAGRRRDRLSLATRDGRPALALEIGAPNPAGTGLYVRRADRPYVLLLGGVLRWELAKLRDAAPQPSP
jgi:hypothetical protein